MGSHAVSERGAAGRESLVAGAGVTWDYVSCRHGQAVTGSAQVTVCYWQTLHHQETKRRLFALSGVGWMVYWGVVFNLEKKNSSCQKEFYNFNVYFFR